MRRFAFAFGWSRYPAAALAALAVTFQALPVWALSPGDASSVIPNNLNLSSPHKSVTVPQSFPASVIVDAGRTMTVRPGSLITPAQAVALAQVLSTGYQSIVLSALGTAVGGSMILSPQETVGSLTVPHGVSVMRNFSAAPAFN